MTARTALLLLVAACSAPAARPPAATVDIWRVPAGFTKYDDTTAFMWLDNPRQCSGEFCWAMEVVTRGGCDSMYVELSIVDEDGTAIGFTNEVTGEFRPDQKARLEFATFEEDADEARITTMSCN